MSGGSKSQNRRLKAAQRTAGNLTDEQRAGIAASYHTIGAGFLVCKRLRLPPDMVEPYSAGRARLTDPFGLAVREVITGKPA